MAIGLCVLGWPPAHFWGSTLAEINAAAEGLAMKNGAAPNDALSRNELDELMAQYPDL